MGSRAPWTMTTAIDTNVIVALWDRDPGLSSAAQSALDVALGRRNPGHDGHGLC